MNTVPLQPKHPGGPLKVIIIGRISTEHQQMESVEASMKYAEDYLRRNYDGLLEIRQLGERASGMLADRPTIREAQALIDTGEWDLVLVEELSRIYRNPRFAYRFVQDCVDAGTRVIAIGDNLDTADENWEPSMGVATLRHSLHIPDTRRRVRRTATKEFDDGGMVLKVKFSYRKLDEKEAASGLYGPVGLRIMKLSEHTPIVEEMARKYIGGWSFADIADWLNQQGTPPPPYSKLKRWREHAVHDLLTDPILGGTRTFRDTLCQRVFSTGKHKVVRNAEPATDHHPELAHLGPDLYQRLWEAIDARCIKRSPTGQPTHPRRKVPRCRSYYPGLHVTCSPCSDLYYTYGRDEMKCQNSGKGRGQRCWNHVQLDIGIFRQRSLAWVVQQLDHVPEFRRLLVDQVWEGFVSMDAERDQLNIAEDRHIEELRRKADNYGRAIGDGKDSPTLRRQLDEAEQALTNALAKKAVRQAASAKPVVFIDRAVVEAQLLEALVCLAGKSYDFGDLMRRLLPRLEIVPVQAIDSGLVRPRLYIALEVKLGDAEQSVYRAEGVINLFDPPVHIAHLGDCREAKRRRPKATLEDIAAELGVNRMTVKRALDLARRMDREGITEPYIELRSAPERASRWKSRSKKHSDAAGQPDGPAA